MSHEKPGNSVKWGGKYLASLACGVVMQSLGEGLICAISAIIVAATSNCVAGSNP